MKKNYTILFFVPQMVLLFACNPNKEISFTQSELKWLTPFNSEDSGIYKSQNGLFDTIIFYQQTSSTNTVNSIERGFYNTYSKSVCYKLTEASYHKFTQTNGDNGNSFLFTMSKDDNTEGTGMEFYFLGLLFDENYLKKIGSSSATRFVFDESNATYRELNIVEGIKNFNFDFEHGITSFVDKKNIRWNRIR